MSAVSSPAAPFASRPNSFMLRPGSKLIQIRLPRAIPYWRALGKARKTLFQQNLNVVNIGLQSFATNIAAAGGAVTHLSWAPPAGADAELGWTLAGMIGEDRIEKANSIAFNRYLAAQPRLVDLV